MLNISSKSFQNLINSCYNIKHNFSLPESGSLSLSTFNMASELGLQSSSHTAHMSTCDHRYAICFMVAYHYKTGKAIINCSMAHLARQVKPSIINHLLRPIPARHATLSVTSMTKILSSICIYFGFHEVYTRTLHC